jgi:hypothetical protein
VDRDGHRIARAEEAVPAVQGPYRGAARAVRLDSKGLPALLHVLRRRLRRAAADQTPVRAIVGDDPVEFAEAFAQAYTGKQWIDKERARLVKAIEDAEPQEPK